MKARSTIKEATDDLASDIARAMFIERRHSEKIGSRQAMELIGKVNGLLSLNVSGGEEEAAAQDLTASLSIH